MSIYLIIIIKKKILFINFLRSGVVKIGDFKKVGILMLKCFKLVLKINFFLFSIMKERFFLVFFSFDSMVVLMSIVGD